MKSNHILRTAVAACFGTMAVGAFAGVLVGGTTPVRVAKELPSTTTALVNAGNVLDLEVTMPAGAGATGTNPVFVKLALTNGAKFGGTPAMNCNRLTGAGGGTALTGGNGFPAVVQNGGAGFSTVTFVITGDVSGNDTTFSNSATCTAIGIDLTISGLSDIAVSATVEFTNGLLQASANANGSYVTFVDSFSATFSAGVTGLVVDATSGSDNFVIGSNLTSGTGVLGFLSFNRGGSAANSSTMGTSMSLVNALDSATVTISGPAIAAFKAASSGGVYLTTDAGCATVVAAGHAFFDSTAATSVTFSTATPAQISAGFYACGIVSAGTQVIGTGQITGQFGGVGLTGVTINFGAAGNMQNVTQNGSTKNAYFLNASTSAAKTSVIRIVNTGGNSGTIRATAYLVGDGGAVDGTQVGNANSTIGTLTANQSLSLTSAQLETALGFTPASGTVKYRVVFAAGLANFEVLNFTRDVASGAITLSQAQTN